MANFGMNQNTCPQCGCQLGPQMGPMGYGFQGYGPGAYGMGMGYGAPYGPGFGYGPGFNLGGWGLGGLRTWGGTYSPQFMATGLPTDEEITEMVYDSLDDDILIPWDADINVDVRSGEVTLSGTVPSKRIKHAAGDDTWWVPGVIDVHNELQISGRHRYRSEESATQGGTQPSKQLSAGATKTSATSRSRGRSQMGAQASTTPSGQTTSRGGSRASSRSRSQQSSY